MVRDADGVACILPVAGYLIWPPKGNDMTGTIRVYGIAK